MSSPDDEAPLVLDNPPIQPPPDTRLIAVAVSAREMLNSALKFLSGLATLEGDAQFVHAWHLAQCAMAWDVSEGAIGLSVAGPLRAARTLNRSLFEYTIRAHYYVKHPHLAKSHYETTHNLLRRVMKGAATYGKAEPAIDLLKDLYGEGQTDAKHPKIRAMIDALVENVGSNQSRRQELAEYLDAEYSLSTAIAHGSQASLVDALQMTETSHIAHRRSRSFTRTDELLRTVTTVVALLAAFQRAHGGKDLGVRAAVKALNEIGPFGGGLTTLGRENALRVLLDVA